MKKEIFIKIMNNILNYENTKNILDEFCDIIYVNNKCLNNDCIDCPFFDKKNFNKFIKELEENTDG